VFICLKSAVDVSIKNLSGEINKVSSNLVEKFALKKNYYLLTFRELLWYILDNGNIDWNFKIATTPII